MRYLTGVSNDATRLAASKERSLGLILTPDTYFFRSHIPDYSAWAADNACFNQGAAFDLERYLDWLGSLIGDRDTCLFATAPDVVGDMLMTWVRSVDVLPVLRTWGVPAALVAQNGLTYDAETDSLRIHRHTTDWTWTGIAIGWDEFDVLFVGGDDPFKLSSPRAWAAIRATVAKGKPVHMGRVNSFQRLDYADALGCRTADGTYLAFGPEKNLPRLLSWLQRINGGTPWTEN